MALIKGVNVYLSSALEKADAYFADRTDAEAWNNAAEVAREAALLSGTSVIDRMTYLGVVVSVEQKMAFPRAGAYFDPRLGARVSYPTLGAPLRVIEASYEMSLHLLNNKGVLLDTGSLSKLEIGPITLEGAKGVQRIPVVVRQLLAPITAGVEV